MIDQEKKETFLGILARHAEKFAFGAAVVALLGTLAYSLTGKDPKYDQLSDRIDSVQRELEGSHPEFSHGGSTRRPEFSASATMILGRPGDCWSASLFTKPVGVSKPIPSRPPSAQWFLPSIELGLAKVTPHQVELSWTVVPVPEKQGKTAVISHFILERKIAGSGRFDVVAARVSPNERAFTDVTVKDGRSYRYRLTPRAKAIKPCDADRIDLDGAVDVPEKFRLSFSLGNPGTVFVKIEKDDRVHGVVRTSRLHRVGDLIGRWAEQEGGTLVTDHLLPMGARALKVDLDTGLTIASAENQRFSIQITKCRKTFTPKGPVCEETVVLRPKTLGVVVLRGDEGLRRVVLGDASPRDERCPLHRGKK